MSVSEREQAVPVHRERRMLITTAAKQRIAQDARVVI